MKYLEKAFHFLIKNYVLMVPLFIVAALPSLIATAGAATLGANMGEIWTIMQDLDYFLSNPKELMEEIGPMLFATIGIAGIGGFLAFILNFVAYPATGGMIKKGIETGRTDLSDFSPSLSEHFKTYFMYWLGKLVFGFIVGIIAIILFVILGVIVGRLGRIGMLLAFLGALAIGLVAIVIAILVTLWFPAMIIDNLGIVDGFKKSIEVAKSNFWTLLGIAVLVSIASTIVGGIVGMIVGWIPFIGTIIVQVIPTFATVLILVFQFMLYADNSGKNNTPDEAPEVQEGTS